MSAYNRLADEDTLQLRDIAMRLDRFARWAVVFLGPECRYDHHGYCQAHGLDEKPCPVERVSVVLREVDDIEGYE